MAAKPKTETPAPTMADVIRNRAYQIWGVGEEGSAKQARPKSAARPKKTAKKASKPAAKKTAKSRALARKN